MKKKTEMLKILHEISVVVSSLDLGAVIPMIIDAGISITRSEEGCLYLVENGEVLEVACKSSSDKKGKIGRVKIDDGILGDVVRHGKSINTINVAAGNGQFTQGIICVPLTARNQIIGVLVVYNLNNTKLYDDDDVYFLSTIGNYSALAIDNYNLLDKAQTLSSISSISQSLLTTYDLDRDLGDLAAEALKLLNADIIILYQYDSQTDDVVLPPIIKGVLKFPEQLQIKGKLHKSAIVFKLLERKETIYAQYAKDDWISRGYYEKKRAESNSFIQRENIKSSIGVPLIVNKGKPVGVLFVNFRTTKNFSSDYKEKISLIANQSALIIHNLNTHQNVKEYSNQLSVLNHIGRTISESVNLNLEDIFSIIHKQTAKLMDVSNFYISFFDEEDRTIHFKFVVEQGQIQELGEKEWKSRRSGNGLTEYLLKTGKPLLLSKNIREWFLSNNINLIGRPAKSWLGAPMISRNKVIGVIAAQNYENENVYTEQQKELFAIIASHAAVAIENTTLLYKLNDTVKGLEKLGNLSNDILSGEKIQEILDNATRASCDLTGGDICTIHLFRPPDKGNIYIESVWFRESAINIDIDKIMGYAIRINAGVTGTVASTMQSLIVPDVTKFPKYLGLIPTTQSEITIPL